MRSGRLVYRTQGSTTAPTAKPVRQPSLLELQCVDPTGYGRVTEISAPSLARETTPS